VAEGTTSRFMHGLVKQTQCCMNFIVPWSRNGCFQIS